MHVRTAYLASGEQAIQWDSSEISTIHTKKSIRVTWSKVADFHSPQYPTAQNTNSPPQEIQSTESAPAHRKCNRILARTHRVMRAKLKLKLIPAFHVARSGTKIPSKFTNFQKAKQENWRGKTSGEARLKKNMNQINRRARRILVTQQSTMPLRERRAEQPSNL